MRQLKKLGVKTVVSLRTFHSDRAMIGDTGLSYVRLPMTPLAVSDAAVVGFLKRVADKKRRPVFVHCLHGSDRTGVMCAAYRIVVQGWSRHEAIREMTTGGFGHHKIFATLAAYLRKADFDAIRRKAGLAKPTSPD
jgi:protein tyrosine/serine phosphatase